ncbi:MAG: hypothetical protein IKT23_03810, partial [Clostridia bacterium]|nr:hypothetical protein [Clostridia bacterium]
MPVNPTPARKKPMSAKARACLAKKRRQWAIIILTPMLILALVLALTLPGKGRNDTTASEGASVTPVPDTTPYADPTPSPTAQPIVYLPVITKG